MTRPRAGHDAPHDNRSGAGGSDGCGSRDGAEHAREHGAFTRLWERHHEDVRRYLLQRCAPEHAEDLVQEAFLRVWEARRRQVDEARLPAYLLTVARNLWIDHLRWQRNWGNVVPLEDVVLAGASPERQLAASLRYEAVQRAVRGLSPRRRAVFELRWLSGLSHGEIAERLRITVKTVENHLNVAYGELRSLFEEADAGERTSPVGAPERGRAGSRPAPTRRGAP